MFVLVCCFGESKSFLAQFWNLKILHSRKEEFPNFAKRLEVKKSVLVKNVADFFTGLEKRMARFALCSTSQDGISKYFDKLLEIVVEKLARSKSENDARELMDCFDAEKLGEVSDVDVRTALERWKYSDPNEGLMVNLLLRVDSGVKVTRSWVGLDAYTLEHIIHQSPKSPYVKDETVNTLWKERTYLMDSLGNMCLLSQNDNSFLLDKCFENKLSTYKKYGEFKLTSEFFEKYQKKAFTPEDCSSRGNVLVEKICKWLGCSVMSHSAEEVNNVEVTWRKRGRVYHKLVHPCGLTPVGATKITLGELLKNDRFPSPCTRCWPKGYIEKKDLVRIMEGENKKKGEVALEKNMDALNQETPESEAESVASEKMVREIIGVAFLD